MGIIQLVEGWNRTKRQRKAEFTLSELEHHLLPSDIEAPGSWPFRYKVLHQCHPPNFQFSGLQTGNYTISSSGSQAFGLQLNSNTGFPGSPAYILLSLQGYVSQLL